MFAIREFDLPLSAGSAWTRPCARTSAACPSPVRRFARRRLWCTFLPCTPAHVRNIQQHGTRCLRAGMSHTSQIPGSTQQRNKTQQSANTGKAFFPGAADRLRSLFLQKLQGIDDPTQQVAIHSQLLVHLWVRPFQRAALQRDGKFLYNTLRSQLRLALDQLQERIEPTLRQEKTALCQLQAAAKLLVSLTRSPDPLVHFLREHPVPQD